MPVFFCRRAYWQFVTGFFILFALVLILPGQFLQACDQLVHKQNSPILAVTDLVESQWFTVTLPNGASNPDFQILPAQSDVLKRVDDPFWQAVYPGHAPVFVLNGGFFDPMNAQSISHVFQHASWVGDPVKNDRLMDNASLQKYLPGILNRTEFRTYQCANGEPLSISPVLRYEIVPHDNPSLQGCQLIAALGGGPALLPVLTDRKESFTGYNSAGKKIRDSIGVHAQNARSAVGITQNGDVVFVMAGQKEGKAGASLAEVAAFMKTKGVVNAMALDGGSSSSFWMLGKTYYGKRDRSGRFVKRPVKSVMMIVPR